MIHLVLLLALLLSSPAGAETITGTVVKVHDGDTLTLDSGAKVRVFGIDAPELVQKCRAPDGRCEPCGQVSKAALSGLVMGKLLVCSQRGKHRKRIVAECSVDGMPIGPWMIQAGQAVAYNDFLRKGDSAYLTAESKARAARVGLWNVVFVPPADWRNRGARLECER